MTDIFPKGYIGAEFKGKLIDNTDPLNPVTLDLTGNSGVYILFYKPDGTVFPTQAEIDGNLNDNTSVPAAYRADLETPGTPADSNIRVRNFSAPSLLDQYGKWEYVPAARFQNGNFILSHVRKVFWVE